MNTPRRNVLWKPPEGSHGPWARRAGWSLCRNPHFTPGSWSSVTSPLQQHLRRETQLERDMNSQGQGHFRNIPEHKSDSRLCLASHIS